MTTMNPQDLPEGWRPHWDGDPLYVHDGKGTDVEMDTLHLRIEWTEGADDHYGSAKRSAEIPTALVRALLARLDATEATP